MRWIPLVPALVLMTASAAEVPVAPVDDAIVVTADRRADSMVGATEAASTGMVGGEELATRPLLRPAEILESIPGMIATQHSGSGKANQYFLRGFNLDHGTDFATRVEGMPVNQRTHGHGQGYTDLNFLIPELVERIDYRKGPYHAEDGDFASAGAADITLADGRPGMVQGTVGMDQYGRGLVMDTAHLGEGRLLYGLEATHYDGPWTREENLRKGNAVARYGVGERAGAGWSLGVMAYAADWDATDQIPSRAVEDGRLGRLDGVDPTVGGESQRFSLDAEWRLGDATARTAMRLYAIRSTLGLWSNFTYALDDPVNGDQFEQVDRRTTFGGSADHRWSAMLGGVPLDSTVGMETRHDLIDEVGLHRSRERVRLTTVRDDRVVESSIGVFARTTVRPLDWLRVTPGLRGDLYGVEVDGDRAENSGSASDGIVSPKLMVALGPWAETEYYIAGGLGFHSNDARGATIATDPVSGTAADPVDLLVRTEGAEIGVRTAIIEGVHSSMALWVLDIDSELLFIGDAGGTEATRPSRRYGVEWANAWAPADWLSLDADYAWTHARFRDASPGGDRIPGAPERVIAAGLSLGRSLGPHASLRLRYFGPRPLVEDDSVRSDDTTLINAAIGWRARRWQASIEALNLFDSEDHDIDYLYESQLPGEAGPTEDLHYHPVEPLTLRGSVAILF